MGITVFLFYSEAKKYSLIILHIELFPGSLGPQYYVAS